MYLHILVNLSHPLASSLSPHNSMEGSPRMVKPTRQSPQRSYQPSSSDLNVSMGKKTIRNYTPKESSNMLKELEENRMRIKKAATASNAVDNTSRQQKPVDRMIDDFHRNLPTPPPDPRQGKGGKGSHEPPSGRSTSNSARVNSSATTNTTTRSRHLLK